MIDGLGYGKGFYILLDVFFYILKYCFFKWGERKNIIKIISIVLVINIMVLNVNMVL